jgi:hypothetical protein
MTTGHDAWRKSSHSGPDTDCVEIHHDLLSVRDSKNPDGAVLRVDARALVAAAKVTR